MTHVFDHPFLLHALLAGIPIAALTGLVGYFVVLRSQVFTGDALSHVAFTGALGALALGVDARLGLFAATVSVGLLLGLLGRAGRADDVVIGTVFAWVLGVGVLALSVYTASARAASDGAAGVRVLFGSVFGLSLGQARVAAVVAAGLLLVMVVVARPLLFSSLDEAVAGARGLPVTALGVGFLGLVGATAAEASQAVGALLLLGLLSAPGAAAIRLTTKPYRAMALSATLSVAAMVGGLLLSDLVPRLPPSFCIVGLAAAAYGTTLLVRRPLASG